MKQVPLGVLEGHKRYVTSCAFSDDGALVAAGSGDRVVKVWRVDGATNSTLSSTSSTDAIRKLRVRFPSYRLRENTKVSSFFPQEISYFILHLFVGLLFKEDNEFSNLFASVVNCF